MEHKAAEHDQLIALAARLVLQAVDNDLGRLESTLGRVRDALVRDYPHLAR